MRYLTAAATFTLLSLFLGCSLFGVRDEQARFRDQDRGAQSEVQILQALNQNSARINAIDCSQIEIECKQGGSTVTPVGKMACQKPRSFYLKGKAAGMEAVQMGSNSEEFWYWLKDSKYLCHCSWDSFKSGTVQGMQLPFQPEWLMEVIGMSTYDEDIKKYNVTSKDGMLLFEQQSQSPSGEPMKKVLVVDKSKAFYGVPLVKEYQLLDKNGKLMCSAVVAHPQYDKEFKAVIPFQVDVKWPSEQVELKLTLRDAKVVREIDRGRAESIFSRKDFTWATFDLAKGRPDSDPGIVGGGFRPASPR